MAGVRGREQSQQQIHDIGSSVAAGRWRARKDSWPWKRNPSNAGAANPPLPARRWCRAPPPLGSSAARGHDAGQGQASLSAELRPQGCASAAGEQAAAGEANRASQPRSRCPTWHSCISSDRKRSMALGPRLPRLASEKNEGPPRRGAAGLPWESAQSSSGRSPVDRGRREAGEPRRGVRRRVDSTLNEILG